MKQVLQNNLLQRIASACVLIPLTVFAVYKGGTFLTVLMVALFLICIGEWVALAIKTQHKISWLIFGITYLPASFLVLWSIADEIPVAISFLIAVWASDSLAYIFGKTIGGPKLIPSISPNKTWAGLCGAIIGAMIGVSVFEIWKNDPNNIVEKILFLIFLGIPIGICAQLGDFLVSFLKRRAGVKDTGKWIPGHGGLLDRLDSLLFAVLPLVIIFYVTSIT